jgi:hypothetical protein
MLILRIAAGVIGAALAARGLFYILLPFGHFNPIALAIGGVQLVLGAFALWFAIFADDARERTHMKRTRAIAAAVGLVAFLAGFLGPIILAPQANQGPLLGIFITGPLGFLFGGLAGFVWSRLKR